LLHTEAKKRDISVPEYREQFEQGLPSARSAEVIVEAVKTMAVQDSSSKELRDAHLKIQDLEDDVDNLKVLVQELRKTPKSQKKSKPS
jgi:uncharacterized protein Yka (UPF0111/DUF47 family)